MDETLTNEADNISKVASRYTGTVTDLNGRVVEGGSPILQGARIPSGVEHVKVSKPSEDELYNSPEFIEAFGLSAAQAFRKGSTK